MKKCLVFLLLVFTITWLTPSFCANVKVIDGHKMDMDKVTFIKATRSLSAFMEDDYKTKFSVLVLGKKTYLELPTRFDTIEECQEFLKKELEK